MLFDKRVGAIGWMALGLVACDRVVELPLATPPVKVQAPAGCNSATKDGAETDIDCGGGTCAQCTDGKMCVTNKDCASGVCQGNVCIAATCTNGVQNGAETDVDCGGTCPACSDGQMCTQGSDCLSGVCQGGVCMAATCSDSVKNGAETSIDCGGGACPACSDGQMCTQGSDCLSGVCQGGICMAATCSDSVKNGAETSIDCGGGACPACSDGQMCTQGTDCLSGVCQGGVCISAACVDGVKNGAETSIDCGGTCPACSDGQMCTQGSDCTSSVCLGGVCAAASCSDSVKNGAETDIDCGGPCARCSTGAGCVIDADCKGGMCAAGKCSAVLQFVPGMAYGTSLNPIPLALHDVTGNGTLDVLAGGGTDVGYLHFHSGNGDGTFMLPTVAGAPGNSANSGIAVADYNRDGKLDVALTEYNYGAPCSLRVYAGNGIGSFPTPTTSFGSWPGTTAVSNVTTAHFNSDTNPDLAVALIDIGYVGVLANDGTGNFSLPKTLFAGNSASRPQAIAAGDFDGNGLADIAVGDWGDGYVHLFPRTGSFVFGSALSNLVGGAMIDLESIDIDKDGKLDLVAADCRTGVGTICPYDGISGAKVLFGNGNGTFQPPMLAGEGTFVSNVAVADFNVDGRLDVAYVNAYGTPVSVVLGNGNRTFRAPVSFTYPNAMNARWVETGDLNGDGKPDLVIGDYTASSIHVLLNTSQ